MRNFFENFITIVVTGITLVLCWQWYRQHWEIEPLIGMVVAGGTLLTGIVFRIFPEKKEAPPAPIEISTKRNAVEDATLTAGANIGIGDHHTFQTFITYDQQEIPRSLTPPPFRSEVFLGRETDLQTIHDRLFSGEHLLLLVNGEGGVGKTTLAAKYYLEYQQEYAHTAWVLSEKNLAAALLLLAEPLGLKFDERMPTDQRLPRLLTALADLQRPCLLVIDNANELADLQTNDQRLRQLPNFHLLLTTRITDYGPAHTHRIEGLSAEEALQLFQHHYPQFQPQTEAAIFRDIHAAVDGNTLIVELLAKNLALHNTGLKTRYALPDLLADLQKKGVLQLSHTQSVRTDYQSRGTMRQEDPKAIIAAMYDLGELSRAEVFLLSVFALLPAESLPFTMLERLILGQADLDSQLILLAQKGWIAYNKAAATFKCSPVVQEVVRQKNPDLLDDGLPLVNALIKELDLEVLHLDNYQHSTLFARYAEAVVGVWNRNDYELGKLCQNVGKLYMATGDLGKAMSMYQRMADIQSALFAEHADNVGFKSGLAIAYGELGETHTTLGNLPQALQFFKDFTKLFKELYADYPQNVSFKNGLAIAYEKLGKTHTTLGNLQQGLQFFEESSRLTEELYAAYPQNVAFKKGLAIAYKNFGSTHSALGNLEQALQFFEGFAKLAKELYAAYPQNVSFKKGLAVAYEKLGKTHTTLGNLQQALQFFEDFAKLTKELYAAYPQNVDFKNGLAISYSKLGKFYRDHQVDKAQARLYYTQCQVLWHALATDHSDFAEFQRNLQWVENVLANLGAESH